MTLKKTVRHDEVKPLLEMLGRYDPTNHRLVFAGVNSEKASPDYCNVVLYVEELGRDASHARVRQHDGTYKAIPVLDPAGTSVGDLLTSGWKVVPETPLPKDVITP